MDDLELIRAGMPTNDGCPILGRLAAFVVQQGTTPTLEHVFRKPNGNPADLTRYLAAAVSESISASATTPPAGTVLLRVKEWTAEGRGDRNPIWSLDGTAQDPARGLLRATLPATVTALPGIYELAWGIVVDGRLIAAAQAMLSVERSLFPADLAALDHCGGPVTLGEIRGALLDSGAADNLLLDDVEFSDAQIFQAIVAPVRLWNEAPPPIERYTTRTFPFKGAWLGAIAGELHLMAATNYRRNLLRASAGGLSVPDKDKEQEYLAEGLRLVGTYKDWLVLKKQEINLRKVGRSLGSEYSGRYR